MLAGQILLSQAVSSQTMPNGFKVAGRVVNSITGTGISGVSVYLINPSNRYDATTGPTGEFQLGGVKAGTYAASFQKTGFFPADPRSIVRPLQVGPSVDSEHVRSELAPAAILRGRVFDPDGQPAPNAQVEATPATGTGCRNEGRLIV